MRKLLETLLRPAFALIMFGVLVGTGVKITDWVWQKPRVTINLLCDDTIGDDFVREHRATEM